MTNTDTTDNTQIDGAEVEVTDYETSGTNNSNGKQNKARSFNKNERRMACFSKVQRNLSEKNLAMILKRKVFNQCVLPAMTCLPNMVSYKSVSKETENQPTNHGKEN